jgi:hypothetical protein
MRVDQMAYDWVKRLGQWHIVENSTHGTICGMALLGNNYAREIPECDRKKCPKCHGLGDERL